MEDDILCTLAMYSFIWDSLYFNKDLKFYKEHNIMIESDQFCSEMSISNISKISNDFLNSKWIFDRRGSWFKRILFVILFDKSRILSKICRIWYNKYKLWSKGDNHMIFKLSNAFCLTDRNKFAQNFNVRMEELVSCRSKTT